MFVLKCEFCGYKQTIKKKIDKYTYYELTHCKHLWCPCNKTWMGFRRVGLYTY